MADVKRGENIGEKVRREEIDIGGGTYVPREDFTPVSMVSVTATNATATATVAAAAGVTHYCRRLSASFGATAPATVILLTLADGTTIIGRWYVPTTGVLVLDFDDPVKATEGNKLEAVLAAGGSGVIGVVNLGSFSVD